MPNRRPIVNVAGDLREIGTGDVVHPATLGTGTPSASTFLRGDGTWDAPPAGAGAIVTKVKSADQGSTLIATTDITDLTHAVAASTRYNFWLAVRYTSAATATGLALGVNGPIGSTVSAIVTIAETATTVRHGVVTALDGKVQALASAAATEMIGWVHGTILIGAAAGTLAMRFGTETAGSSVTIKAGSILSVWT